MTSWSGPIKGLLFALLLVGIAGFGESRQSTALFTAQVTIPGNTFQAGTLKMSNSRAGQALFTTTGAADGVATSTMSVVGASGTRAFVPGPVGSTAANPLPTDTGFQVAGSGGAMPGMLLTNSVTIGNVGTLAAGAVNLSVSSITVTNNASAHCDASNALLVNGVDTCGRGRLTDMMRLTAFYRPTETQAVCVVGNVAPGTVVVASSDGEAIMACGNSGQSIASPTFGATLGIPLTRNAAGMAGGPFALAETSAPLTISNTSTAGDRIEPELTSMPVWNFRNGVSVRDWAVGETRTVTFALSIDPTADNRYQGARAAVDFRWESTSLSGAITATAPGTVAGTGSVAGTLTGPSGALASQSVQLFPLGGAPLGTTTGTDGSFTFPTVASGTYNVVSWVDAVPVVKTVSVVAGQQSTVAMVATPVDRTVAVTVSPAPTADAPWSAYAMVSAGTIVGASSTYQASFGGQAVAVTSSSVAVSYRSADAANTWINLYQGQASPSAPPTAQFSRALADSPSTLVVAVPTLTVSGFSCTVAICTTTLAVTGAPPDARVDAFLAQTWTYSYGNPATVQGQLAGSSVALSFARPTDGSYVVRVYLSPATTTSSIPAWSWSVRLPTTLTVAPSVT